MSELDKLIHGKSDLKRVVALEVIDDKAEVFQQAEDGTVSSVFVPHRFWMLSNRNIDGSFVKLNGTSYYSWGKQFSDRVSRSRAASMWRNEDLYQVWNESEAMMIKDGICYYQDLLPTDIAVLGFDLETTGLNPLDKNARVVLISNTFRSATGQIQRRLFSYDEFENEESMLIAWCEWARKVDPSIITGHNIFGFDLNYLIKRSQVLDIGLELGRDGSCITQNKKPSSFRIDGSRSMDYYNVKCYGREFIDGLFLAIRYDAVEKKYENNKLKTIIAAEGLEKKDRTFYDASQIRHKYKDPEEFKKIKEYCKDDSDDAIALFDLMAPAYFYQCQSVPRTFQHLHLSATGALINGMLVRSYLQDKYSVAKADKLEKLEGGISFAIPGVYRNVIKVDIRSAYPSQVLRFKLFDSIKDPLGNFYKVVKYFTEQRFYYKKMYKETSNKKWKDLDSAGKIYINSGFGTCSTNGLNYNSPWVAAKITLETRNVIDMSLKWASNEDKTYWINLFKELTGHLDEEEN